MIWHFREKKAILRCFVLEISHDQFKRVRFTSVDKVGEGRETIDIPSMFNTNCSSTSVMGSEATMLFIRCLVDLNVTRAPTLSDDCGSLRPKKNNSCT